MFLHESRKEIPDHFMALANPTRLRILQRLGERGEVNVSELAEYMHMSQPRISWHVRMLRLGNVIRVRRDGRQVWCSLDVESIRQHRERLDAMLGIGRPQVGQSKVREEVGA